MICARAALGRAHIGEVVVGVRANARPMQHLGVLVQSVADGDLSRDLLPSCEQCRQLAPDQSTGESAGRRRLSEIIDTIDGIAFQTSILALNTAVEAAQAEAPAHSIAIFMLRSAAA